MAARGALCWQDLTRLGQTSVEEPCEPNLDLYAIMKQPPASIVGRWCSIEVGVIAPQSSSSVQIFVRGALPNKTMILDVHLLEESVRDVMVKIQERQGSGAQPLYKSYLIFCSRVMENDRLLSDYHVQKESTLHFNYRLHHHHGRLTDRYRVHFERLPNEREVSVNVRLPTGKMERGIVHQATTVARLMHALTATDSAAAMRALADAPNETDEVAEAAAVVTAAAERLRVEKEAEAAALDAERARVEREVAAAAATSGRLRVEHEAALAVTARLRSQQQDAQAAAQTAIGAVKAAEAAARAAVAVAVQLRAERSEAEALVQRLGGEREAAEAVTARLQAQHEALEAAAAVAAVAARLRLEEEAAYFAMRFQQVQAQLGVRGVRPAPAAAPQGEEELCVVCVDARKDRAMVPCGHVCACEPCAVKLMRVTPKRCPICRDPVLNVMRVFL
jgi:hypothetical protein